MIGVLFGKITGDLLLCTGSFEQLAVPVRRRDVLQRCSPSAACLGFQEVVEDGCQLF